MKNRNNILLGIFLAVCSIIILNSKAYAADPSITRYGGHDRYETSVEVSKNNFTSSGNVIIASGQDFADALCASSLAGKYEAPILTTAKDKLRDSVVSEIKRLGAKSAVIVGGDGVVSDAVKLQLQNMGISVKRIGGHDRYETSIDIAKEVGGSSEIALASGESFADALSIAPVAAAKGIPILLTSKDGMTSSVKKYIDENKAGKTFYVIGGEGVISNYTASYTGNYTRLGGKNRYETNTAVINKFISNGYMSMNTVYIASGADFPDALSASAAAAQGNSPVVLADAGSKVQQSIIKTNISSVSSVKVVGGIGAVSNAIVKNLVNGKTITVTLDAGHGGYDSGAVGPSGTMEKNITLAIVLKTGRILSQSGINVVYTRTNDNVSWPSDVNQDLQARCNISDNANSDYFVSVHMNSAEASQARGTESYYYSSSTDGKQLAQDIQKSLVESIGLTDRGIKTANYYVIKYTKAPAVLIEVGFISNPQEEKLLNDDSFQNKAAGGIAEGIMEKINQDN